MPLLPNSHPARRTEWVDAQGGRASWAKWVKARHGSCRQRAKRWNKKTGQVLTLPAKHEWTTAIFEAQETCGGGTARAAVERRLVSDMKTILDVTEFKLVIAHLGSILGMSAEALVAIWMPRRNFSGTQGPEEPAPR